MPDRTKNRGPHPQDLQLFRVENLPSLRNATRDLSWLLTRHYAPTSALKLVGDRYALDSRQRIAVARCACGEDEIRSRQAHQVQTAELENRELWIDAFNVLTSVEAALSGGVILHARDGCYRDMASMHGSYRKVKMTMRALEILGALTAEWKVARCHWLLDQPVSNSGRLKTILGELGERHGWKWEAELVPDPDAVLIHANHIIASADSQILNHAPRWFNLASEAIDARIRDAWIVRLAS